MLSLRPEPAAGPAPRAEGYTTGNSRTAPRAPPPPALYLCSSSLITCGVLHAAQRNPTGKAGASSYPAHSNAARLEIRQRSLQKECSRLLLVRCSFDSAPVRCCVWRVPSGPRWSAVFFQRIDPAEGQREAEAEQGRGGRRAGKRGGGRVRMARDWIDRCGGCVVQGMCCCRWTRFEVKRLRASGRTDERMDPA